jgi:hypothetical protein
MKNQQGIKIHHRKMVFIEKNKQVFITQINVQQCRVQQ